MHSVTATRSRTRSARGTAPPTVNRVSHLLQTLATEKAAMAASWPPQVERGADVHGATAYVLDVVQRCAHDGEALNLILRSLELNDWSPSSLLILFAAIMTGAPTDIERDRLARTAAIAAVDSAETAISVVAEDAAAAQKGAH